MTNEEMERGIEFLLKSQANFEARQASYEARQAEYEARQASHEAQLMQTSQQVETLAKTQIEFAQFVRGFMEAQGELNQSLRETVRALTISQARTDERLSNLEHGDADS
jgi:predicted translin family RNA/ssDNA-binding protein